MLLKAKGESMLKYNIQRMFSIRGITNPSVYLTKHGFKDYTAYKIVKSNFASLSPQTLEKLCLLFNCTPNDLMEWTPEDAQLQNENIALKKLIAVNINLSLSQIIKEVPAEKMNEFVQKVEELKKNIL